MVVLNGANTNFIIQKKYYGSASEAFLRSKAALKIPVQNFFVFFQKFHCLWWPSMYVGGIWCRNFRFSPIAKNVKNAIFHILTFLPKKLQKMFSANILIIIYIKIWALWALEFLKYLLNWLIYKVCEWGGVKSQ